MAQRMLSQALDIPSSRISTLPMLVPEHAKTRLPLHRCSTPWAIFMKTYDIDETADFLKVDRETARDLATAGELPGAKVGRAWVFLETDLVEFLKDRVRRQTNQRRAEEAARQELERSLSAAQGRSTSRKRPLPKLPELPGEVTSA
jgi:excisionase family DNA binding protein